MMKHPPGCHRISGRTYFTLYAPYAQQVRLLLFEQCHEEHPAQILPMRSVGGGYWEYSDIRSFEGYYYTYRIDDQHLTVADPYARSVAVFNDFHQQAKGYVPDCSFDWEGDSYLSPADPRDMIIYEAHVKDMTGHPSAETSDAGTFSGLKEKIGYLKELGVNAIELMPIQQFANFEPPYSEAAHYIENTWNPYAYNHWGYMTSFFFAPVGLYSKAGNRKRNDWCDPAGQEISELKSLVKELHRAGISVIMDVVYNHISQYNLNPLRFLAESQYIDPNANTSGCGNDIRSDIPVTRQLITDSIRFWMEEYHIDGFRFDLAGLIDDETLLSIKQTAKSIHSGAVLVGEPWGKRYFPQRMSELEFGVWNDMFRNGVKGENPFDRKGFIFGQWERGLNKDNIAKLLTGSLQKDGGLVSDSRFTVNYLASHDGYTLGDFIRLSVRKREKTVLPDHRDHVSLDPEELALHKMSAFILACSQGIMMMHAGQEFARSKVIAEEKGVDDPYVGELDHDSYNKDNKTNYLDFEDLTVNQELYEYYRSMIALRKALPELRSANRQQITVLHPKENEFAVGYVTQSDQRTCAVLINTSRDKKAVFELDGSSWTIFADRESASVDGLREIAENRIELLPGSPLLLVKN